MATEPSTSSRAWLYAHCNTLASQMTLPGTRTVPRVTTKAQKVGSGPIPGNPCHFSKVTGIIFPLVSLGNHPALSAEQLMFQTVVLEKILESPLDGKIKPVNSKGNQPWIFIGRTDAEVEALILWPPDAKGWLTGKDPDGGKRLKAGGEWDDRGGDGWRALMTQWTWVWANSRRWWRTGKPGVLQSRGLQRVRHNWATEQIKSNHNNYNSIWTEMYKVDLKKEEEPEIKLAIFAGS